MPKTSFYYFSKGVIALCLFGAGYIAIHALTKNPCVVPKTFSIGTIDPQFGISRETVALYSKQAAATWNTAYAQNTILEYATTSGDIEITFVYDERQRITIANEKLKRTINEEKVELTTIKGTIDSLRAEHQTLGAIIESKTVSYDQSLAKHNTEVSYWNARGGAPSNDYQRLQREEATLETDRISLNNAIARYNQLAKQITAYAEDHNQAVDTINTTIGTLNRTALREFEEGTYDPNTRTITIYEYADETSLKRVLIHELGHALGLDHVDDADAIMYPINQGKELTLAQADEEELSQICKERTASDILNEAKTIGGDIFHLVQSSWRDTTAQAE